MGRTYKPKTRLDKLVFSPSINPLAESTKVKTKTRYVRTGRAEHLANIETGEITHTSILHEINEVDKEQFIKIFSAGAAAMMELSRTARKVFDLVLKGYQESSMTGGYADTVELYWFNEGISGKAMGIGEKTFRTGLKELIDKQFLHPRLPHSYWVNPNLFFKGDRVMFIKEYRKTGTSQNSKKQKQIDKEQIAIQEQKQDRDPNTIDLIEGRTDAELNQEKKQTS